MGQGVVPDDWVEGEYCRYAVCWPNSPQWLAVLRGVLTLPATGRFWDENTGIIVNAQSVIRETFDINLHLQEVIMACGDAALSEIAAALRMIAANSCCGDAPPSNGGIQIFVETPLEVTIPIYGSVPPGELTPGEIPTEYPGTVEEYDVDKCRTAALMITGWIQSIRNLASINFASSVGLLLVVIGAVAGLIILPAFLVPVLIAAAIGHVGINAALSSLADEMESQYNDLVCILYENSSTQVIAALLADALDAIIALIPATGALAIALKTIALVLMNSDTLNQLFTMTHGVGADYDCSGCGGGEGPEWEIFDDKGSFTVDGNHYVCSSEGDSGGHRLKIRTVGWPTACAQARNIGSDVAYTSTPGTDGSIYYLCGVTDAEDYEWICGDSPPVASPIEDGCMDGICINAMNWFSWAGPFTVTFDSEPC